MYATRFHYCDGRCNGCSYVCQGTETAEGRAPGAVRIRYTSRATYRFRHRIISLLLLPSAVRLATYSRVRSSQLIRPSASMCSARLASLLPPRLRRWRSVLPEEAGTGATPHKRAKDPSLLSLSGLSPTAISSEAAGSVPTPGSATRAGTASDTNCTHCSSPRQKSSG